MVYAKFYAETQPDCRQGVDKLLHKDLLKSFNTIRNIPPPLFPVYRCDAIRHDLSKNRSGLLANRANVESYLLKHPRERFKRLCDFYVCPTFPESRPPRTCSVVKKSVNNPETEWFPSRWFIRIDPLSLSLSLTASSSLGNLSREFVRLSRRFGSTLYDTTRPQRRQNIGNEYKL